MLSKVQVFLKKHQRTILVSLVGFLVLTALTAGPVFVSAMLTLSAQQAAEIQAKNSAIEAAIINNDYATWSNLVSDEKLKSQITAQNFPQFSEAYRLLQQGKVEEANLIKKQLSLKQQFQEVAVKSQMIDVAITNGDYAAWRSIVGSQQSQVTSDNFSDYSKAYAMLAAGNLQKADSIKRNIGVKENFFSSSH